MAPTPARMRRKPPGHRRYRPRAPNGIAFDPATHTVYTANALDAAVSVVNLARGQAATPPGSCPKSLSAASPGSAIDAATHTIYVANSFDGTLSLLPECPVHAASATGSAMPAAASQAPPRCAAAAPRPPRLRDRGHRAPGSWAEPGGRPIHTGSGNTRNWLCCVQPPRQAAQLPTARNQRSAHFRGSRGPLISSLGVPRSETSCQPASSMHTGYARRCVTGPGRPCRASRQPSQAAFRRSASRTPREPLCL